MQKSPKAMFVSRCFLWFWMFEHMVLKNDVAWVGRKAYLLS